MRLFLVALLQIAILMVVAQPDTSKVSIPKKGIFFSYGIGGGFIRSDQQSPDINRTHQSAGISRVAKLGYAINPRWSVYYLELATFSNEETLENSFTTPKKSIFGNTLMGLGATYYFRELHPTYYVNFGIGIGFRRNMEVVRKTAEKGNGFAFSIGGGYQFANRWGAELNLYQIPHIESAENTFDESWEAQVFVVQFTINYIWYKSYKIARMKRLGRWNK